MYWTQKHLILKVHTTLLRNRKIRVHKSILIVTRIDSNLLKTFLGSEEDFKFVSRAILMSNLSMVLQVLFALSIAGLVLPLCLLRFVHRLTLDGQISKPASPLLSDAEEDASPKKERIVVRPCNCISVCLRKWLRRFWLLANINHLCYPLIGYVLFIAVGPWSVGYFLGDHVGVIFSWGMYIKGTISYQIFCPKL